MYHAQTKFPVQIFSCIAAVYNEKKICKFPLRIVGYWSKNDQKTEKTNFNLLKFSFNFLLQTKFSIK
jgi:hypothetical protein